MGRDNLINIPFPQVYIYIWYIIYIYLLIGSLETKWYNVTIENSLVLTSNYNYVYTYSIYIYIYNTYIHNYTYSYVYGMILICDEIDFSICVASFSMAQTRPPSWSWSTLWGSVDHSRKFPTENAQVMVQ